MGQVQVFCFLASYLVAWILELTRFLGRSSVSRVVTLLFAGAGFVAHTWYLIARSQASGSPPLLGSSKDWLLVLAWLVVSAYLFLTLIDSDLAIGVFVLPLVELFVFSAQFVRDAPNTRLDALHGWKMLHASLLVLGMLGIVIGVVLALMYFVQQSRLRHHQPAQPALRIPSLEKLARLNWFAVVISVPLLTLGILTGAGLTLYAQKKEDPAMLWTDPVVLGNTLVWIAMMAIFVRLVAKRRTPGRQVAVLTMWGGGFLIVMLLGLQILTGQKVFSLSTWHM